MERQFRIWFGPGGIRGAFAAGVARGLDLAIQRNQFDPSGMSVYGSSVGCLTACYLATSNTENGLDIFRDDARRLLKIGRFPRLLFSSFGGRLGLGRNHTNANSEQHCVLDTRLATEIMLKRTPNVFQQIKECRFSIFAECVHKESGQFQHVDLRGCDDPLTWIRRSMNMVPFTSMKENSYVDSNVKGYGFVELLDLPSPQPLVLVMNSHRFSWKDALYSRVSALTCADQSVASYYRGRRQRCREALERSGLSNQVLVVARPAGNRRVEADFQAGMDAAAKVTDFVESHRGEFQTTAASSQSERCDS